MKNENNIFKPADILIPRGCDMEKWAVIACDQFTSEPEYWDEAAKTAGDAPSALNLILPEVRLGGDISGYIADINGSMEKYLNEGIFAEYRDSFIYVERTLMDGKIRRGIVGMLDLEEYAYIKGSGSRIRPTERTVPERIPPRKDIRKNALLELPHILVLCDDEEDLVLGSVDKEGAQCLYDFDLMLGGGNVKGWLIDGKAAEKVNEKFAEYSEKKEAEYNAAGISPLILAVGDGNHSLATAKVCWEELKNSDPEKDWSDHPARYVMVEIENIRDDAQEFEPIYRIVKRTNTRALVEAIHKSGIVDKNAADDASTLVTWYAGDEKGTFNLKLKKGQLPIDRLQAFLDDYLEYNHGVIDYIHGVDSVKKLSEKPGVIGFVLPEFDKNMLFNEIAYVGVCPRKTFSIGHAREKRYYIEARKIR